MNEHRTPLFCLLVVLFGLPIAFSNLPQDALTQAMIVVVGLMLAIE